MQWLSGRVLVLGLWVLASPEALCCVLEQGNLSSLSTGSTQEDLSRHNWSFFDWDIKNESKQNKMSKISLRYKS